MSRKEKKRIASSKRFCKIPNTGKIPLYIQCKHIMLIRVARPYQGEWLSEINNYWAMSLASNTIDGHSTIYPTDIRMISQVSMESDHHWGGGETITNPLTSPSGIRFKHLPKCWLVAFYHIRDCSEDLKLLLAWIFMHAKVEKSTVLASSIIMHSNQSPQGPKNSHRKKKMNNWWILDWKWPQGIKTQKVVQKETIQI